MLKATRMIKVSLSLNGQNVGSLNKNNKYSNADSYSSALLKGSLSILENFIRSEDCEVDLSVKEVHYISKALSMKIDDFVKDRFMRETAEVRLCLAREANFNLVFLLTRSI